MSVTHRSDVSDVPAYVSPAIARAADLGFCPDCAACGQYVPTAPGRRACLTHLVRPAESPVERSDVPTHAPAPVEPATAKRGPKAARFRATPAHTGRPRRRLPVAAPRPDGRYRAPHPVAAVCAVPGGSRKARGQAEALRALQDVPDLAMMRADRQATLAAVWQALVWRADWSTMVVTVAWDQLAAASGRSRRTVARCLAWYRSVGLLGVVYTGATAQMLGGDTNRAPAYVLCLPEFSQAMSPVDEHGTPTEPGGSVHSQSARARLDTTPAAPDGALATDQNPAARRPAPTWSLSDVPRTRRERLDAAEALRWHSVTLRPISPRMLRHILRPWHDAGWTPRDVLHALDHLPGGEAWRYAGLPRVPAAWVRYRLGAWLDLDGRPVASRSQRARRQA